MEEITMKKPLAGMLAMSMIMGALAGCSATEKGSEPAKSTPVTPANLSTEAAAPKYVFLFVGDGMSYPQIQSTSDYLGALNDADYFMASPAWTTTRAQRWMAPNI